MESERKIPSDFVPYNHWSEFLEDHMYPSWMHAHWVGDNPRGLARYAFPWHFESYTSDTEPVVGDLPYGRLIIWQPLSRQDIPQHWWRSGFLGSFLGATADYREGYARLGGQGKKWSETDRRMQRRWSDTFEGKTHVIEKVSHQAFWDTYKNSITGKKIDSFRKSDLLKKMTLDAELGGAIEYRIVRSLQSGEIVAGLATVDSRIHKSSYYFMAFIYESAKHVPAMVGLVHDWFIHSEESGFSTVQFGRFRSDKYPRRYKEWSGFSTFKSGFGTEYIEYPPVLFRYVRARK